VKFCWLCPGEELVSTVSPDAAPWAPCPSGGFVYKTSSGQAFSFGITHGTADGERTAAFPSALGPLEVMSLQGID
jgi:hypothetical protein